MKSTRWRRLLDRLGEAEVKMGCDDAVVIFASFARAPPQLVLFMLFTTWNNLFKTTWARSGPVNVSRTSSPCHFGALVSLGRAHRHNTRDDQRRLHRLLTKYIVNMLLSPAVDTIVNFSRNVNNVLTGRHNLSHVQIYAIASPYSSPAGASSPSTLITIF